MKLRLWLFATDTDNGPTVEAFTSAEALKRAVGAFVKPYWEEAHPGAEMPDDPWEAWSALASNPHCGIIDSFTTDEQVIEIGISEIAAETNRGNEAAINVIVDAARRLHHEDGRVEIDDVSILSNPLHETGTYVLGWLWVPVEDIPAEQRFPIEDWRYEVANGDTRLGYEDWLEMKCEEAA